MDHIFIDLFQKSGEYFRTSISIKKLSKIDSSSVPCLWIGNEFLFENWPKFVNLLNQSFLILIWRPSVFDFFISIQNSFGRSITRLWFILENWKNILLPWSSIEFYLILLKLYHGRSLDQNHFEFLGAKLQPIF